MATETVYECNYVKRGDGTTLMSGAVYCRLPYNPIMRQTPVGYNGVPVAARQIGASPSIVIYTADLADVVAAIVGTYANQVLVIGYNNGTADVKQTIKFCTLTDVAEAPIPPIEGGGESPLFQLTFEVHKGTGVTSLATAIAASTSDTVSGLSNPNGTLHITSVGRGAAGATALPQPVQVRLRPRFAVTRKRAGASELPDLVRSVCVGLGVGIETEDHEEARAAVVGTPTTEILAIVYADSVGSKTLTIGGAQFAGGGEVMYRRREGQGTVARPEMRFEAVENGTDDTWAELVSIA